MLKSWRVSRFDRQRGEILGKETEIPAFAVSVLASRGIDDSQKMKDFLKGEGSLKDPFSLVDMDRAVGRIKSAMENGERICIFGDYDADGVTSSAILYLYLKSKGAQVACLLPRREEEGYGLSETAVESMAESGVELVITVDNGVSAAPEIEYAKDLGLDVVVTDHHIPPEELPLADAVVNPHRKDCPSGLTELSGAGVALCLVCAMEGGDWEKTLDLFSDVAAVGTVADVMSLTGMNRALVAAGIAKMKKGGNRGLKALIEESGIKKEQLTATSIAFGIAPRINAAGRLATADLALKLLVSKEESDAKEIAGELCRLNERRQSEEASVLTDIDGWIAADKSLLGDRVLVFCSEKWNAGVIGIAASRAADKYGRPVVLLSSDGTLCRGSARSREGFNIHSAFAACSDLMVKYGGHALAAGLTITPSNLGVFRKRINEYADEHLDSPIAPVLRIDGELEMEELTVENARQLKLLEPFGSGNPQPLFVLRGVTVDAVFELSGGKYAKLALKKNGRTLQVLYFGGGAEDIWCAPGDVIDAVVSMQATQYKGQDQLSVILSDCRPGEFDETLYYKDMELYRKLCAGDKEHSFQHTDCPQREDIARVYQYIKKTGTVNHDMDFIFLKTAGKGGRYFTCAVSMDALCETDLCRYVFHKGKSCVTIGNIDRKVDIFECGTLSRLTAGE